MRRKRAVAEREVPGATLVGSDRRLGHLEVGGKEVRKNKAGVCRQGCRKMLMANLTWSKVVPRLAY